jgi:PE family
MSYVNATPEMMTAAATDLATIASDVGAAHTAAAPPTVALVPAAADEVSESIAHLFSQYGGGVRRWPVRRRCSTTSSCRT